MAITDKQARKLMEEFNKHGKVGIASIRSNMDRKTGRKYLKEGKLPSELKKERIWQTRTNPFEKDWQDVVDLLKDAPELEAKTIFDFLVEKHPKRYEPGQLRTLQRRIKKWRAIEGPDKRIFFPQEHRPGEAIQTDFTRAAKLKITINGEFFPHLLCHQVLPYSNWEWATVCRSESIAALNRGVQEAVFLLGRSPEFHQTDNSTAATHNLGGGKRAFNEDYKSLMRHLEMTPRTTAVGEKEQNGDVESLNGALKSRIKQRLLLRGSRDFESVETYEKWLQDVIKKANELRSIKLGEELRKMPSLSVNRLPEFTEKEVRVSSWSTIRVLQNTYSVPSRLKGEKVKVRTYENRLEVFYGGQRQLSIERLLGKNGHRINYRHIIWSLVRKPGAFLRYKYREELFPSLTFRRAYDELAETFASSRDADLHYLRILHLAASTMESDVETALEILLQENAAPEIEAVKALLADESPKRPEIQLPEVSLKGYDKLLRVETWEATA